MLDIVSEEGPPADLPVPAAYHEVTKHHLDRYARSPGYLDWKTQPDPFRRFLGADLVPLPLAQSDATPPYDRLYERGAAPARPLSKESLGEFLEYALGLTAWKSYGGSTWALRSNPSSGNLHPTEGYVVLPALDGVGARPGVYHYAPKEHGLERRAEITADQWQFLTAAFPPGSFLAGLSSVHWREAWKYGERAYRYCQHDAGHALACLRYAAAALGWRLRLLEGAGDAAVARLLGLDRADEFHPSEREVPDLVAVVSPADVDDTPQTLPGEMVEAIAAGRWHGRANQLSPDHAEWEVIDVVSEACVKPETTPERHAAPPAVTVPIPARPAALSAATIFRQRRSCLGLDGVTRMSRDVFYAMLVRVVPAVGVPPFDAVGWRPCLHLGLFVHRVDGLPPGLYALARSPDAVPRLQSALAPDFAWSRPEGCPDGLNLFLLKRGDARKVAEQVSCHQDIAGDGAFSLGMLAEWDQPFDTSGWLYRRLFWESGMIGQVLYLEAEAAGLRGTGIGCFFDDAVHTLFGVRDRRVQSLYHFTVGGPVEDTRLRTIAPYAHLAGR